MLGGSHTTEARAALTRLAKSDLKSHLDSSVDLLDLDAVVRPSEFKVAIDQLASFAPSRTLRDVGPEAVAAAQAANSVVILAVCQMAGLSYRDLFDRAAATGQTLPGAPRGRWRADQITAAFQVVDEVISGRGTALLPGGVPARPIELLVDSELGAAGWEALEHLRAHGVPYEVLLAQRAVGGAWLAHRNQTTSQLAPILADQLCQILDGASVKYWRGVVAGGDMSKKQLGELVSDAGEAGQVGIVTQDADGNPGVAIAFAFARDGGTARKSAGRLEKLPDALHVPPAVVILGPGWATRGETIDLIAAFQGRVFTESTLVDLASLAAQAV
jgi:hypothetical protein